MIASSATFREAVTRNAELSGPCSDSLSRSNAATRPFVASSQRTMDSLGPAGMPGSTRSASSRFAEVTQGLPGPTIFRQRGTVSVPKATAATACAPPHLKTLSTSAKRAATKVAASILPPGPGGVMIATFCTPATTAGMAVIIATLGNEPFPLGT